jgi:nicotinate-nucleotide adenylyltransferase
MSQSATELLAGATVHPASQRVGLLFGSFNPVHMGHLILAEYFATRTDLSEVWLVVSPQSPFKVGEELLPDTARLALLQLAVADNPRLRAEAIELSLSRPSYTIATLDALRARHPTHDFVLLMGGDNVPGLPRWRAADRLLSEFDIYVYPRPGTELPDLVVFPRAKVFKAPLLDVSATFIRASIEAGQSIRYLVPPTVEQEIITQKYYH